ncbi:reverse transcriptase-like protein [Rhizorhabdus sp.]|jgi:ribonuclease HI|uniref:reverse transcriptase-like protein n=1 Tax=Rhizorhabdus sp. TaxID=1968843 RepID=UPI001B5776F9|nr:reverse transcriptase-like protein [Rhizorhabdus sp.]MBP8231650.1 reverse transcriptase-like protein [Rhizorhabdus sp.]
MNKPTNLYFDGGCRPNPGAMETATVLRGVAEIRTQLGQGDNEDAEWSAVLHALDRAQAAGLSDIVLLGDSLSVIRQATDKQMTRRPWLARFRAEAAAFDRVRLRHVGRKQNLAGIALEAMRRGY